MAKNYWWTFKGTRNEMRKLAEILMPLIGKNSKYGKLVTVSEHYLTASGEVHTQWIGNFIQRFRLHNYVWKLKSKN